MKLNQCLSRGENESRRIGVWSMAMSRRSHRLQLLTRGSLDPLLSTLERLPSSKTLCDSQ